MSESLQTPPGYADLLAEIKTRVRSAQVRAAFAVSRELILLYWSIGRDVLNRQQAEGWGGQGHRTIGNGSRNGISGSRRIQSAQLEIHAEFSRGVAGGRNSATACGTFAVGPSPSSTGPAQGPRDSRMVSARGDRARLEPEHPGPSNEGCGGRGGGERPKIAYGEGASFA